MINYKLNNYIFIKKLNENNKKNILKYTTVSGVQGFDGSTRKTDNSIIKSIE